MTYSIQKVKDVIHYMRGFSLVGFLLYMLLGSIAPSALVSIIVFGFVLISLLVSIIIPLSLNNEITSSLKQVALNNISPFITILLTIWTIVINAKYYDRINDGAVAAEFYRYSFLSLFAMICQVYVSFVSMAAFVDILSQSNNNMKNASIQQKSKMNAITYIITPLNIVLLTIMQVILEFFSTDG